MAIPETIPCPGYDYKLFDSKAPVSEFWKCGLLFHCHYFQVHSDPEWSYLLGFHQQVK